MAEQASDSASPVVMIHGPRDLDKAVRPKVHPAHRAPAVLPIEQGAMRS